MRGVTFPGGRGPVIAVIGGGASGTLAAVHLLRTAAAQEYPLRIVLLDRLGRHGRGQAYATTHPDHLMNAPAAQMSALADDRDHCLRWAAAAGMAGTPFLPRHAYGRYLCETLEDAERTARSPSCLTRVCSDVLAVRHNARGRPLRLLLADGCIDADYAVLATGHLPPALPVPMPDSPRVIADPWAPGALSATGDGSPVLVVGTGLTMTDVAVAVTSGNRRTTVSAVSRHGLLPQVHREHQPAAPDIWLPVGSDACGPVHLTDLIWQVRAAMAARPGHWQAVVDALRPQVPSLWRRMSPRDRRLFLRHVARYWEVHRHRMPPATARRITELRCTGRLSVIKGQVIRVTERDKLLRVRIARGGGATEHTAGWLINATGPAADVTRATDPLLLDLLGSGLARPDPLRLGIDADRGGAVISAGGLPSSSIFTLGPPLRGVEYETTAIPEIREQAAVLARHLAAGRQVRDRPGSAA
jgi:uncharacterized NAD(P)/FAD-binding protein YdhS